MGKRHKTKHLTMFCDNNNAAMHKVKIANGQCKFTTENVEL